VFFNRGSGLFSGVKHFHFPMPLSPEKLVVNIRKIEGEGSFSLKQTKVKPQVVFYKQELMSIKPIIKLFEMFAFKAGFLDNGVYFPDQLKQETMIIYRPYIKSKDEDGKMRYINSPAKIELNTGVIEVSRKHFKNYTVSMRMFILLHEISHYLLQSKNEILVDRHALQLYLALGYPGTEAMYSLTRLMEEDTTFNRNRLSALNDYILRNATSYS
jgi:hypothetical protein